MSQNTNPAEELFRRTAQREIFSNSSSNSGSQLSSSITVKQESTSSHTLKVSRKRQLDSTLNSESLQIPHHPHPLLPLAVASKQSTNSSTVKQSAQFAIAERFLASATFQSATLRNSRLTCPLCKNRYYEKVNLIDHLNIFHFRRATLYCCNWPGCRFTNQWRLNAEDHVANVHKDNPVQYVVPSATPGAVGQQQQQQSVSSSSSSTSSSCAQVTVAVAAAATSASIAVVPTTAAAATSALTLSSMSSNDWERTEAFLNSAEFAAAGSSSKLPCPFCAFEFRKFYISDHIYGKHFSLKLYSCTYGGCTTGTSGFAFLSQMQSHVKKAHNRKNTERYIRRNPVNPPAAAAVVPASTFSS